MKLSKKISYALLTSALITAIFNLPKFLAILRASSFAYESSFNAFYYQLTSHFIFCLLLFYLIFKWFNDSDSNYYYIKLIGFAFLFTLIISFISTKIHLSNYESGRPILIRLGYLGRYFLSAGAILLIFRIIQLIELSVRREQEINKLELEKISAQYDQLKNKINPHFFFNTLNSLTALIRKNPSKSITYVQYLSKVFRHSLTQEKDLVDLKTSLDFLNAYMQLQHLRYGKAFKASISVDSEQMKKKIVSMSLQTLVENALKHNKVSTEKVLNINIFVADDYIWVENNFQPVDKSSAGEGFGLNSLYKRHEWLGLPPVKIHQSEDYFKVSIPLIKSKT
jgi:sensor histidine kinase YesM